MTMMTRTMTTRWRTWIWTSSNRPDGGRVEHKSSALSNIFESMMKDVVRDYKRQLNAYAYRPRPIGQYIQEKVVDPWMPHERLKWKIRKFLRDYRPVVMTHRKLEEERYYYY